MAAPRPAIPGEMIDIGGRRLRLVRAGPADADLTVLLEAGSFGYAVDWTVIQADLAQRGLRSIAYDRAGLGHSDRGPVPRDGRAILADLQALLAASGEAGPFLYVGHSMAGLHAYLFAAAERARLVGLVLVDAITPASAVEIAARRIARQYVRVARLAAWAAEQGLMRPFSGLGDTIGLPPGEAADKRRAFADPLHNRGAADEVVEWDATLAQAAAAGPLDADLPVAVVTAGPVQIGERQRALMAAPARASRAGSVENVAAANHASLLGRRHGRAIVAAIEQVRRAAART